MKSVSAQAESCCVYVLPPKRMQHMQGIIPYLFDCWADPVVHLLLLKSSVLLSMLDGVGFYLALPLVGKYSRLNFRTGLASRVLS